MMLRQLPILVLSVHCSSKWIDIQHQYIKNNTANFEYAIVLMNCAIDNNIKAINDINIISSIKSNARPVVQHLIGLNAIAEYANANILKYRSIMILDSDCFPIANWEPILFNFLEKHEIICPTRYENYENYPHPSIIISKQPMMFGDPQVYTLDGQIKKDPVPITKSGQPLTGYFPLIRTNRINYHHLAFGIYHDTFYHHAAGSRLPRFKSNDIRESTFPSHSLQYEKYDNIFWSDPDKFITSLLSNSFRPY